MTTSPNTVRTRRRTAKTPEDIAPASAAIDSQEAARPRRKPTKPPSATAQPATPTGAPAGALVARARRKTTKPAAGTAQAIPVDHAATAAATTTPPGDHSAPEALLEIGPSNGTTGRRLVDRIARGVVTPPADLDPGPATTAALAVGATRVVAPPVAAPPVADAPPAVAAPPVAAPPVAAPPVADAPGKVAAPRRGLGRGRRTVATPSGEEGPPIGSVEVRLFDCPKCGRPLATGTSRCPGCGAGLFRGVALRRVGTVAAAGIAVCLVVGGGIAAAAMGAGGRPSSAAAVSEPSSTPMPPTATPTTSIVVPPAGPPAGAPAVLSATVVLNGRITADADVLAKALAQKGAKTIDIARAIRSLAGDAALGIDLAGKLAPWPDAAPVRTQLDEFYRAVAQSARVALRASLTDGAGYRRSGAQLLVVLRGLGAVDEASRALAASVGLELPPLAPTVP